MFAPKRAKCAFKIFTFNLVDSLFEYYCSKVILIILQINDCLINPLVLLIIKVLQFVDKP